MNEYKSNKKGKKTDESKMMKVAIATVILLLVIAILFLFKGCASGRRATFHLEPDSSAVDWSGNQKLDGVGNHSDYDKIAIPCFDGLTFKANQTTQKVNIYNPETNKCYMIFSIIIDGETIWQSGNVAPSKGYYEIELIHAIDSGVYDAYLLAECFDMKGNQLNNGLSTFILYVQ